MPSTFNVSVDGDVRPLVNTLNKLSSRPLGSITGKLGEFSKALDASNQRVLAFGASVAVVYTVQKAFTELIETTIDVEKTLVDINSILNLSSGSLDKFGTELFSIAKSTGQTFKTVGEAAQELARQGLGMEETLKRASDAMILARLSGLSAKDSIEALTAAINSFNESGLNSSEIIGKIAKVDQEFAVSSKDLAESIARVGSTAQDAGVSLDQLLGITAAVQQTTSRGGAVIGNALKTIFTRLERRGTIESLQELGVQITETQTAFEKLQAISARLENTTSPFAASQIKEAAAGVYQINILNALLNNLAGNYSLVEKATKSSSSATTEAIERNEKLNESVAALINRTFQNLGEAASNIGNAAFKGPISTILNALNSEIESFNKKDIGKDIGVSILSGIAGYLSGPGAILILGALSTVFVRVAQSSKDALATLLGLNKTELERREIEALIYRDLLSQKGAIDQIKAGTLSTIALEREVLQLIEAQVLARGKARSLSGGILNAIEARGYTTSINTGDFIQKKGFRPNAANSNAIYPNYGLEDAVQRELAFNLSPAQIRVGQDQRLKSGGNPLGLGIYNTRDEPAGLSQGIARATREGRNPKTYGTIPGFAKKDFLIQGPQKVIIPPGDVMEQRFGGLRKFNKELEKTTETLKVFESIESRRALTERKLTQVQQEATKIIDQVSSNIAPVTNPNLKAGISTFGQPKTAPPPVISLYKTKDEAIEDLYKSSRSPSVVSTFNQPKTTPLPVIPAIRVDNLDDRIDDARRFAQRRPIQYDPNITPEQAKRYGMGGTFPSSTIPSTPALQALLAETSQKNKPASAVNAKTGFFSRVKNTFSDPAKSNNLLLAGITGSILAGSVASSFDQDTKSGRVSSAIGRGIGDTFGYAGTGFALGSVFPGGAGVGTGIGLAVGVASTGVKVYKALNDEIPELTKNFEQSSESLSIINDSINNLTQVSETFSKARAGEIRLTSKQQQDLLTKAQSSAVNFRNNRAVLEATFQGDTKSVRELTRKDQEEKEKAARLANIGSVFGDLAEGKNVDNKRAQLKSLFAELKNIRNEDLGQVLSSDAGKKIIEQALTKRKSVKFTGGISNPLSTFPSSDVPSNDLSFLFDIGKIFNTDIPKRNFKAIKEIDDYEVTESLPDLEKFAEVFSSFGDQAELLKKGFLNLVRTAPDQAKKIAEDAARGEKINQKELLKSAGYDIDEIFKTRFNKRFEFEQGLFDKTLSNETQLGLSKNNADFVKQKREIGLSELQGVSTKESFIDLSKTAKLKTLEEDFSSKRNELLLNRQNAFLEKLLDIKPEKDDETTQDEAERILKPFIDNLKYLVETNNVTPDSVGKIRSDVLNSSLPNVAKSTILPTLTELENSSKKLNSEIDLLDNAYSQNKQVIEITSESLKRINKQVPTVEQAIEGFTDSIRDLDAKTRFFNNPSYQANFLNSQKSQLGFDTAETDFKRKNNLLFSDEYANEKQGLRIRSLQLNPEKFDTGKESFDAFRESLTYGTNDIKKDLVGAAREFGGELKSGFSDSWKEFARGQKSAGEALKSFALGFAFKIQDKIIDIGTSSLFNALGSGLSSAFTKKNKGGIIGYSNGGLVVGGSGLRDDVPAVLSSGEYVLQKSAVQEIGLENLQKINRGINLSNEYTYNDPTRPTAGSFNTSSLLSDFALTDENNPQNATKFSRESNLIQYLIDKADYDKQKKDALKKFKKGQQQQFISSLISAATTVGGAYLGGLGKGAGGVGKTTTITGATGNTLVSSPYSGKISLSGGSISGGSSFIGRNVGGSIPSYANGDNVPAMLTGGEFVVRKNVVDRMGTKFFDSLNNPRGYNIGGLVGNGFSPGAANESSNRLIEAIDKLQFSINNKKDPGVVTPTSDNGMIVNSSVTINIAKNGDVSAESNTDGTGKKENQSTDVEQLRNFTKQIENKVMEVIIREKRNGGQLANL